MKKLTAVIFLIVGTIAFQNSALAIDIGDTPSLSTLESQSKVSLKNKLVIVDFWATWCPPCVLSFPFWNQIRKEVPSEKLEILAVNVGSTTNEAEEFLRDHPADFTVVYDQSETIVNEFQPKKMPTSFLITPDGKIKHIFAGFKASDREVIKEKIMEEIK